MAWSYRRSIKIIPGVRMNFSKSGISTSIGVKGASVTFGNRRTSVNTPLGSFSSSGNRHRVVKEDYLNEEIELSDNIFSADIHEITSHDMKGVKEAILTAHSQRKELQNDLSKVKSSLLFSKLMLVVSYVFIYGLIKKTIPGNIKIDIAAKENAVTLLLEQIENSFVALDIELDPEIREKYEKVISSFEKLSKSIKIWDVTREDFNDRAVTRSAASRTVNKKEIKIGIGSIVEIKSTYKTLCFKNANGGDLYFYPGFILMISSRKDFALVGLNEIDFSHRPIRFLEEETIPSDSKIIDKTWAKVNKNGSPDKRFKDNYQIPIVQYGGISLTTNTGLNEEYQFSNYEHSLEFASAFNNFQKTIQGLKSLNV